MNTVDIRDHKKIPVFVFFHINEKTSEKEVLFLAEKAEPFFNCIRYYTKQMCDLLEKGKYIAFGFETREMTLKNVENTISEIKSRLKKQEKELAQAKNSSKSPPIPKIEEQMGKLYYFPNIYKKPEQE